MLFLVIHFPYFLRCYHIASYYQYIPPKPTFRDFRLELSKLNEMVYIHLSVISLDQRVRNRAHFTRSAGYMHRFAANKLIRRRYKTALTETLSRSAEKVRGSRMNCELLKCRCTVSGLYSSPSSLLTSQKNTLISHFFAFCLAV